MISTVIHRALMARFEFEPAYEGQVADPTAAVTMSGCFFWIGWANVIMIRFRAEGQHATAGAEGFFEGGGRVSCADWLSVVLAGRLLCNFAGCCVTLLCVV